MRFTVAHALAKEAHSEWRKTLLDAETAFPLATNAFRARPAMMQSPDTSGGIVAEKDFDELPLVLCPVRLAGAQTKYLQQAATKPFTLVGWRQNEASWGIANMG